MHQINVKKENSVLQQFILIHNCKVKLIITWKIVVKRLLHTVMMLSVQIRTHSSQVSPYWFFFTEKGEKLMSQVFQGLQTCFSILHCIFAAEPYPLSLVFLAPSVVLLWASYQPSGWVWPHSSPCFWASSPHRRLTFSWAPRLHHIAELKTQKETKRLVSTGQFGGINNSTPKQVYNNHSLAHLKTPIWWWLNVLVSSLNEYWYHSGIPQTP